MASSIAEFVMHHPLFCHHNHHRSFAEFDKGRPEYDFRSLLGYAEADLVTAAGARPPSWTHETERMAALWPSIRTTGYGRAVMLACSELFRLDYAPENFTAITEALQASLAGKSAAEVYDDHVREKAGTRWVLQDGGAFSHDSFPAYYRFTWRMDELFAMTDRGPIQQLEAATETDIGTLDQLVEALNAGITRTRQSIPVAALKIGMAYERELAVGQPSRREAASAFDLVCGRGASSARRRTIREKQTRPLSDYLLHSLFQRADEEDLPVQIHTGYLAGNWGALMQTRASLLIPVFERYRRVRFDIFHGSWPWTSELGAIAKSYPNVYPDLCWAWAMNPEASERALSEWLDAVPHTKIFAYGADTNFPWCDVGYAAQARLGIAHVLERKVQAGHYSSATAEEVAEAIMLRNGEVFFGLA